MTSSVTNVPDRTADLLPRERLCLLAGVERGKHNRWIEAGHLARKDRYAEVDVIRAAVLDELVRVLRPTAGQQVWRSIRDDLGLPGPYLEVVVAMADRRALLVRSLDDLGSALPRGEQTVVVTLHERIARARERLSEYRLHLPGDEAVRQRPAGVDRPTPLHGVG